MSKPEPKHDEEATLKVIPAEALRAADEQLAEAYEGEHGTKRDLSPRVVSMIAIAGTIVSLFLGSGSALKLAGPVGCWLAYTAMGMLVAGMMYGLGEMTCYAPNIGGFIEMGHKYVDEAFGFMMGINYILQVGLAIPGELSAIAIMISFWDADTNHAGAYITAFLVVIVLVNLVGVKYYGEIEFFFACVKLLTLVGLIIFGLIADLGGIPPERKFTGGLYWRTEPFNDSFLGIKPVSKSRFLGFWAAFTKAAFSYGGIEGVAVLAGEAHNPRRTMRMAVRTVFYRVVGIYMLAILIIGLNVSQNDPLLLDALAHGGGTATASPFVVICVKHGVRALPSIINAVVMTSALSACNENAYATSRTLMALARQGAMPQLFLRTTSSGVPIAGVAVSFAFGLLAYLSLSSGSNQAFTWLTNLSALSSLVGWLSISICFVRFKAAVDAQGLDRRNFTLRSWFQPYLAYACIVMFATVLIFNGFTVFIHKFDVENFVASYITLPVIVAAFVGYKIVRRTKFVDPRDVDLGNGPAEALMGTKYDPAYA